MPRELKYFQAIHEATDLCLARDPSVYVLGLGATDPKGIFGTTLGLEQKYPGRVLDMPCAENGMSGIALGSTLVGMRPIMLHQRIDFALLAVEQLVNQAAKWHYMFGGAGGSVPMVVRLLVGRGWGQGPQHSQSLQAWFAHIPGLRVVLPSTPQDAKGLLIAAVEDDNPVIFIEHRWLHNISGPVPEGVYRVPLGKARLLRRGHDITIAAISYMSLEAHRAAEVLAREGVEAEVLDLRSLRPLDDDLLLESVSRTGRLLVADTGWKHAGFGAEVVARVAEEALGDLVCPPRRIALPDCPTPTSPALADHYYPCSGDIVAAAYEMVRGRRPAPAHPVAARRDVPDPSFTGPF